MANKITKRKHSYSEKHLFTILIICAVLVIIIGFGLLKSINKEPNVELYPWDLDGEKTSEYTLDEYEALTLEEKKAFEDTFLTEDDFEAWKTGAHNSENADIKLYPWDKESRKTFEYTWEEYEALTLEEKKAFEDTFLTEEDFEVWKTIAQENN